MLSFFSGFTVLLIIPEIFNLVYNQLNHSLFSVPVYTILYSKFISVLLEVKRYYTVFNLDQTLLLKIIDTNISGGRVKNFTYYQLFMARGTKVGCEMKKTSWNFLGCFFIVHWSGSAQCSYCKLLRFGVTVWRRYGTG